MKKILIAGIIVILVIFVIALFSIKRVYFSETEGKVLDTNGNPIIGAEVRIGYYGCRVNLAPHPAPPIFLGSRKTVTNKEGFFRFNDLDKGFSLWFYLRDCGKGIRVIKNGYCTPGETETADFPCSGGISAAIDSEESSISIKSRKSQFYNENLDTCTYLKPTCEALSKKDHSLCNQDISAYGNDRQGKAYCFHTLAVALKDINLCRLADDPADEKFPDHLEESCKMKIIESFGDISNCDLLKTKEDREFCKVSLS